MIYTVKQYITEYDTKRRTYRCKQNKPRGFCRNKKKIISKTIILRTNIYLNVILQLIQSIHRRVFITEHRLLKMFSRRAIHLKKNG